MVQSQYVLHSSIPPLFSLVTTFNGTCTVYREIFAPILFSKILSSLSAGKFKTERILMPKLSLFKHNSVWVNSCGGKTVCECREAKITCGKNNPVCSIHLADWYLRNKSIYVLFRSLDNVPGFHLLPNAVNDKHKMRNVGRLIIHNCFIFVAS